MARPFLMNDPRLTFDAERHVYALGDRTLPSVTQILAAQQIADFSAPHFTDDVRDRGSFVHAAIALDVAGDLDEATLDPGLVPYVAGWRRYLADSGAVVEFHEQAVCDPAAGYAGTLDSIVTTLDAGGRRTRRTVLDIKRALYVSAGPQIAAYRRCAYALYDPPVVLHRAALVLPGDGSYRLHPFNAPEDQHDERVFLNACFNHHWRIRHGLAA